jgi:hypothetical protein
LRKCSNDQQIKLAHFRLSLAHFSEKARRPESFTGRESQESKRNNLENKPEEGTIMTGKSAGAGSAKSGPISPFELGKEQTEAMLNVQKELLDAYEQASREWVARVKSEAALWSELAFKLTAMRSVPEAVEAYQTWIAQRMQMAAEDGQRLSNEYQTIMQKITWPRPNGPPSGST